MMLREHEGKTLLARYGIPVPRGVLVRAGDDVHAAYASFGVSAVIVKAQTLQGRRGKRGGIQRADDAAGVARACTALLGKQLGDEYVPAVRIEERLPVIRECYLAVTYDVVRRIPMVLWSERGGVDIEEMPERERRIHVMDPRAIDVGLPYPFMEEIWQCFVNNDCHLLEINPLIETSSGRWVAADAKVVLDDDAAFRHAEWAAYEPRSPLGRPLTERERAAVAIDAGAQYYRGTASKYIEMDGDIAVLFAGGGASLANMDALARVGLRPANYTEYSGNPPREKVAALASVVLAKPGLRGCWIAGGVANFTDIAETFHGIADALDALRPSFPIVVRRAGPNDTEGMHLLAGVAVRHGLTIRLFGKEVPMDETARTLAELVSQRA